MSWDQTYRFSDDSSVRFGNPGNLSAQPPTPTQTPIAESFSSPTFHTPNRNIQLESGGWTPQFAEEYSVFNSTPGRLTKHHFESSTPRPSTASTQNRRVSTVGDTSADLSAHVNPFSPLPSLHLPPVDPSIQLSSSPGPYSASQSHFDDHSPTKVTPRKPRKRLEEAFSGQTATPPATQSKGTRKLAPKISANTMQNESQDGHYGTSQTPTHHGNLMPFPTNPNDFFSYPMSAPATAPVFTNTKPFWDPDANMGGMDLDFSTDDGMFNMGSHKLSNSFDWVRNNQMFQETTNSNTSQTQTQTQTQSTSPVKEAKRQRPLAPKPLTTSGIPSSLPPFEFNNNSTSDDPFSAVSMSGVDPGLLFGGTNSLTMPSEFADVLLPAIRPVTSHSELKPYQHQLRESKRDLEELQRSRSSRESSKTRRIDRGTVSSPVKGSARPGLQRSVSDSRRRSQDRAASRGRISPVKQQLPSALMSIPELPTPGMRTELKFTIDANGRARTERVVVAEEPRTTRGGPSAAHEEWDLSHYESSSDDEPILVPSRNTSFSIPQPSKVSKPSRQDSFNRVSDARRYSATGHSHSESSSQRSYGQDGVESEAETIMDGDDGFGDATRELRKVMEDRKKNQLKSRNPRHHQYGSESTPRGNIYANYSSSTNISPSTLTDPATTPSSTRSGTTRCVCNNPDSEGFMIQCEACENWLHAECVGIDRRRLPAVYVCAFCAQTPNMRGGRIREINKANPQSRMGSSPLAHKSFKSFR